MMKILVACECSQRVTRAFRARGHECYSCDILPGEINHDWHIQAPVENILDEYWDMLIAFPECRYLANSGVHLLHKQSDRYGKMLKACKFFNMFLNADIERIAVENPVQHGYARKYIRKYDQTIQPWQFGEDASKRTCLWLKNLPPLQPTNIIHKKQYANQTPSGQNKLGPSPARAKIRSKTYTGIAQAMAQQWG